MIDVYDLWAAHDAEQEAELQKLPECECCGHHVQSDFYYLINDEVICEECLNQHFRKAVDDYVR